MKKQYLMLLLSTALLVSACSEKAPAETAAATEKTTPVVTETVKLGSVSSEAGLSAKLAPSQAVQISPKSNGKLTSLPVKLGQYVKQGDVLFRIDEQDLANSLKQAEANYKLAQASLKQSSTNSSQTLTQAQSSLTQAAQSLKDAELNLKRMQSLFNEGAVTAQQLEQAQTTLTTAQTSYNNAKQTLQTAQQKAGDQVSEASLQQSLVTLENAREQMANAVVTSPISGFVSQVQGEVGQFASPQAPVLTVINTNPLLVKVNVSEQDITHIKTGDAVKIEVSALNKKIDAKVTAISPVMDPQAKAYPMEISIPNPNNELKADMVVNVTFTGQSNAAATKPIVSRKAVFNRDAKEFVYVVQGDTVKQVEVTTGASSSDQVEVMSGLKDGDQVVVKGQTMLKDGAKISIIQQ